MFKQVIAKDSSFWISPTEEERILSKETRNPIETVYFLRKFTLPNAVLEGSIIVTAHSRYKLYVNGKFVLFGPCKSDQYHRYCEKFDLAPYLKVGENTILVKVVAFPTKESESQNHRGPEWSFNKNCGCCLFVEGQVGEIDLSTGSSSWLCHCSEEMTPHFDDIAHWLGYKETVQGMYYLDAENIPSELFQETMVRFQANTNVYGGLSSFPLYERSIPFLTLEEQSFINQYSSSGECFSADGLLTVEPYQNVMLQFDAGKIKTGFFSLICDQGKNSSITIRYAEAFFKNEGGNLIKHHRESMEGEIYGHSDTFMPSGKNQTYQPFWFRTFRFVELEIQTKDQPLILCKPTFLKTGYPLQMITTPTQDNETWIQDIWSISLHTLQCCVHETYEDCPYYEQMQYTMDTRLQILYTYALGHDSRLAKKTIYEYHCSQLPDGMLQSRYPCNTPQVIPVFSLHWIFMLKDYYWETADKSMIRYYFGTVDRVLHYFRQHKGSYGLVEKLGYWETVDWAEGWVRGVPNACAYGPSTIQNMQYIYALKTAAYLLLEIDFHDVANSYLKEADEISDSLYKNCYDTQKGLYREGPKVNEYTQHSQMWAVLCKMGDISFRQNLMKKIIEDTTLIQCAFPLQFYLFRAFEEAEMYEQTENLWGLWKDLVEQGFTTVPEKPGDTRSDCHAWGSLMLYEFPHKILGVCAEKPGWDSIVIEPKALYLSKASGIVSLGDGTIEVTWHKEKGQFILEIYAQTNKHITAKLPNGNKYAVNPYKTVSFSCEI